MGGKAVIKALMMAFRLPPYRASFTPLKSEMVPVIPEPAEVTVTAVIPTGWLAMPIAENGTKKS